MHPLHEYVVKQLADKLKERRVVVWYDERGEFRPFVDEVRGGPRGVSQPVEVPIAGASASLVEYAGSLFQLRAIVEPLVSADRPGGLVIYIPGLVHDAKASVLMELEKAGMTWKPPLKQLARNVLLQKFTLGIVDEMLPFDRKVSYEDLARAAAGHAGEEPPSILKSIFHDVSGNDGLLTAWLVSDTRDEEIATKEAAGELTKLVKARLGIDLAVDTPLAKLRAIALRFVLAGEFRLDLACDAPASLDGVPKPSTKDGERAVREVARRLRAGHADAYAAIADRVEQELGLRHAELPPGALGATDTFRFEERALLRHAGELISNGKCADALALVAGREQSFWLDRDVSRKAQWEATRRMAELGSVAAEVRKDVEETSRDATTWFDAYVSKCGWFRLDQAQRRLEAWVARLDEEPDERPLGVVRRAHEDACHVMAEGFTKALAKAGWTVPGALHQTGVWTELVAAKPKPVAYFLVDAMRFEMGAELAERVLKSSEVSLRAAVGALPSITPIGMAALQPGASASFSVVEQDGKLGARIEDSFLPDLASRKKYASARVPKLVDLSLDEVLTLSKSKLSGRLHDAQVVTVRSQEIDQAGEAGFVLQARQVMDTVLDNIARALRRLADCGLEHAVVTADHGHLFFATDRDDAMKIDAPGGATAGLHRRCWIGKGGATPGATVRVSASALGYDSSLEFVFPTGCAVLKAGGDLAYCHGGPSLQELAIPVLSIRTRPRQASAAVAGPVRISQAPARITNRIFSVSLSLDRTLYEESATVLPVLIAGGKQVGAVGMVMEGELDSLTGQVTLQPGTTVTIAFRLTDDSPQAIRIVVFDPSSDLKLYRSPADIPIQLSL